MMVAREEKKATVLVTGGNGFVGSHCLMQLLNQGYTVRTTVRSPDRQTAVCAMLTAQGVNLANLSFFLADLLQDGGWEAATAGCDYVLHVASPFPSKPPKDENELIKPAREGTLRVLRAARRAGVKRVVLTSSTVAITYGHPPQQAPFTEESWTNLNTPALSPYAKSKTLAEQAAWAFVNEAGEPFELSVINPTGIYGPALSADIPTSVELIKRMLNGDLPGLPNIRIGVLDVRDLADLHIRAMTNPAAVGQRFIAVSDGEYMSFRRVAELLKSRLGSQAAHVSTRVIPNWVLRLVAVFSKSVRQIIPELGSPVFVTNEKAKQVLGWQPRPKVETLLATAESLLRQHLAKT